MFLIVLLLAFAAIVYKKPTFSVGLILALLPTYLIRYQYKNIPTTFLELLIIIFLLITFLTNLKSLPELKKLRTINWFALFFVLAGLISVVVSPEKIKALGIFKAFILEPVLFFYALKLVIKKQTDLLIPLNFLFLSSVLISLFGIIQYFTFINLPLRFWGTGVEVARITSFFEYPNALALYLAPLASFFMTLLFVKEKIINRKNLIIGLIIILVALILTFSRGAWFAFIIATIFLLALKYPWKKVILISIAIFIVLALIPMTRQRFNLITKDASSAAHGQLIKAAITEIEVSPLFGNGLYGFRDTLIKQGYLGEIINYPHNIFLNFWVEMGTIGLLSFIGIILFSINQYKSSAAWYKLAAGIAILTIIIHGLVDVPYFKNDLALLFWFIIALFYI